VPLNGATLIGTYQLGLDASTDENGNPYGDASNAYVAYYNDGANRIQVMAEYRDDLPKSEKQLEGYAPRGTLKMMATRFLDYFTQNWGG
jgi:predicted HAD superfamily phosphohydrolase